MRILVVTIGLLDIAFKPMDCEVHFAQSDSFGDAFNAVDADVSGVSIFLVGANERCALDEHAARAASRIKNTTVKRLDNLNDEFNKGGRGEKLSAALSFAHSEIAEKVLVNPSERISFNVHGDLFHDTEEFKECVLFKPIVSLG